MIDASNAMESRAFVCSAIIFLAILSAKIII